MGKAILACLCFVLITPLIYGLIVPPEPRPLVIERSIQIGDLVSFKTAPNLIGQVIGSGNVLYSGRDERCTVRYNHTSQEKTQGILHSDNPKQVEMFITQEFYYWELEKVK